MSFNKKCPNCGYLHREWLSGKEEFLENFKVGDTAYWPTGKPSKVTALGKTSFLYWDENRNRESKASYNLRWYKHAK